MTTLREQVWFYHKRGMNTYEIARAVSLRESQVYRHVMDALDEIYIRERANGVITEAGRLGAQEVDV